METIFTSNYVMLTNGEGDQLTLTHDQARQLARKLLDWLGEQERAADTPIFEGVPV